MSQIAESTKAASVIAVSEDNFEKEVLGSSLPVLVDVWAQWCGPCGMLAPVVEDLAQEYAGRFKFVKVDLDANPGIGAAYAIRSIPTLLVFKGGKLVDSAIGLLSRTRLAAKLNAQLATPQSP
jgi:thioredoxin 1